MKTFYRVFLCAVGLLIYMESFGAEYISQVMRQLTVIKLAAMASGWTETHDDKVGYLNHGDSRSFILPLRKGNSYLVAGVCDNDCRDLDLLLYNSKGDLVARDTSADSMPIVNVTPKWSGNFKLVVRMYFCKNTCFYGVSVLGQ